jgi:hypothetical protein
MGRAILIGPGAFTLIGGAAGICWAMLYRQEPQERAHVYLDDGFPCLLVGAAAGCLIGVIVFVACVRWPGLLSAASLVVAILLGVGIMAPMGWIAGDIGNQRLPREDMRSGAMAGAGIGLVVGVFQCLADWRMRPRQDAARGRAPLNREHGGPPV